MKKKYLKKILKKENEYLKDVIEILESREKIVNKQSDYPDIIFSNMEVIDERNDNITDEYYECFFKCKV